MKMEVLFPSNLHLTIILLLNSATINFIGSFFFLLGSNNVFNQWRTETMKARGATSGGGCKWQWRPTAS